MPDASTFGGGLALSGVGGGVEPTPDASQFGGGSNAGPAGTSADVTQAPSAPPTPSTPSIFGAPDPSQPPQPSPMQQFGKGLNKITGGPDYTPADPNTTALDQSADLLQQRIKRASSIASNPVLQFFDPEGAAKARNAVPQMTEQLQTIQAQKAKQTEIKQMATNYGIDNIPQGADRETATNMMADELQARYLAGDPTAATGLQQLGRTDLVQAGGEQALSAAASNNQRYRDVVGKLSNMRNPGEYAAAYNELVQQTKDGAHQEHELASVPKTYDEFQKKKQMIGNQLSMQQMSLDSLKARMQQLGGVTPIQKAVDKDGNAIGLHAAISSQVRDNNGNPMSGVEPVTVGGIYNGNRLPSGSSDISGAGSKWGLMSNDEIKTVQERIKPEAQTLIRAAGINKLQDIASQKDFGTNSWLLGHGIDQFVEISRNGVGGKGSATPGTISIMENLRGNLQTLGDKAQKEWRQVEDWVDGGRKGPMPYMSKETINGLKSAITTLKTGSDREIGGVAGATAEYVGRHGGKLDDLGAEPGTQDVLKDRWAKGNQEFKQDIASRPAVVMGGQRIVFDRDGVKPPQALTPGGFDQQQQTSQPAERPANSQGGQPPSAPPSSPGAGAPPPGPSATVPPGTSPGGGGGPVAIGGQNVTPNVPPGVSPNFVPNMQRIESGGQKDPWTATTPGSSASGAFQMIDSTWAANKPPGAPARAKDATPEQQTQANDKFMATNAAALKGAGLPVNDTNMYVAHNLGPGGASSLLRAAPNADARTVVGEAAAKNNPAFFKGKPTVATVLARYEGAMNGSSGPMSSGGAPAKQDDNPGLLTRISRTLSQGVDGDGAAKDKAVADVGNAAVNSAPAIGSTLGAVGGTVAGGPVGGVAGGAAGGGAGQALKDYLQGNAQSPAEIGKQAALGGVLGVAAEGRPLLSAAARVAGVGGVEAGATKLEGGENSDALDAGLKGAGLAAGGEMFGPALGMAGHKVWNMFAPEAKQAVREAAKDYHEATQTLATESPKLPGAAGAASTANPKYEAAEAAKEKAETVLKDAGLKPEEAAYAHKVSSENVPKQEAVATRPAVREEGDIGAGYQQLHSEIGAAGVGAVKEAAKPLQDGPITAVVSGKVSKTHAELAQHVEAAVTAPAANWQEKWTQLVNARSDLLTAERDALSSTATGRTKTAQDMRTLADTVRAQQTKAANYVFGPKDGPAFMQRLKTLDVRYRNLMEATGGGDLLRAANLKGEAGRDVDRKFRAMAHDDPAALQAWAAMRKHSGADPEKTVPWTVVMEGIPVVKHLKPIVMANMLRNAARDSAAGSPVKFSEAFKGNPEQAAQTGQALGDLTRSAVQRGVVQQ